MQDRPSEKHVEPARKRLGELAIERGFITPEQLKTILQLQAEQKSRGKSEHIGVLLYRRNLITKDQLKALLKELPQPVRRLGNFELIERIGQGAMGVVFKARQLSMDRIVALKVLAPKFSGDPEFIEQFIREARAAGQFSHENIVSAIDVGQAEPYYYFAMEFIEGATFKKIMKKQGRLPEKEALRIALQIARALEHAYRKNIIHRDVKPDNIILTTKNNVAKLLDLGLACTAGAESDEVAVDEPGTEKKKRKALGTPAYISPEAAQGVEDLDTRADIYSLGCTLFHFLTGDMPFQGRAREILVQHVHSRVPDIRTVNPEISTATARIVARMTVREREKRYNNPTELIEDLEAVLDDRTPVHAVSGMRDSLRGLLARKNNTSKAAPAGKSGRQPVNGDPTDGPKAGVGTSRVVFAGLLAVSVLLIAVAIIFFNRNESQAPAIDEHIAAPANTEEQQLRPVRLALEAATNVESKDRENHSAILKAWRDARKEAQGSRIEAEAQHGLEQALKRWQEELTAALKSLHKQIEASIKSGDFAQALLLLNNPELPANLRIEDWQRQLEPERERLCSAASERAAKLIERANALAAAEAISSKALQQSLDLLNQANEIPPELAPQIQTLPPMIERMQERLKQVVADEARKLEEERLKQAQALESFWFQLDAYYRRNQFNHARNLLRDAGKQTLLASFAKQLASEQDWLNRMLELRKEAFDKLATRIGEEVELRIAGRTVKDFLQSNATKNRLWFVQGGKPTSHLTIETLDAQDVNLHVPVKNDGGEDAFRRGFLFMAARQPGLARTFLQLAANEGYAVDASFERRLALLQERVTAERQIEAETPDNAGLHCWLEFEETGTAFQRNSSAKGANAALSAHLGSKQGKVGKASEFHERESFVLTPNLNLELKSAGEFTIACWVKFTQHGALLRSWDAYPEPAQVLTLLKFEDGALKCELPGLKTLSAYGVVRQAWHHVALSFTRSGQVTLYLDGIGLDRTTEEGKAFWVTLDRSSDFYFVLGPGGDKGDNSDKRFQGLVDELRIYTRVLRPGEIKGLADVK